MRLSARMLAILLIAVWIAPHAHAQASAVRFSNGFPADEKFFPIGVWLQNPRNGTLFKSMGINTFVGLWKGPTEQQLSEVAKAGMYVIAEQTETAMTLASAAAIRGWLQPDEPDNAQKAAIGYGDCMMPDEIRRRYEAIRARDTTRPVFLNFGQGLAHKGWKGRGAKCAALDHDSYYREASRGGDIISFDIYPATEARQPEIYGRLELVAEGVQSLKRWAGVERLVWNVIGTTHINDPNRRPTPQEIRAQVWMSLVLGSRGIVYFLHEWKPSFREDAVFRYPETVREIARLNGEIEMLAPVLNARVPPLAVTVDASVRTVAMARQVDEAIYVFVVALENNASRLKVKVPALAVAVGVAIGEDRPILIRDGLIQDDLPPWGVRLYKIIPPKEVP